MSTQDQTAAVLKHHLDSFLASDFAAVLSNYDDDSVVIMPTGTIHGVAEFQEAMACFSLSGFSIPAFATGSRRKVARYSIEEMADGIKRGHPSTLGRKMRARRPHPIFSLIGYKPGLKPPHFPTGMHPQPL